MLVKRFRRSATKFSTDSVPKCALISKHKWFAMSFREAIGYPPKPPSRGSAPGPRWGTSVPQTPRALTSKSWLRHWWR